MLSREAWTSVHEMDRDDATQAYIDLVNRLAGGDSNVDDDEDDEDSDEVAEGIEVFFVMC